MINQPHRLKEKYYARHHTKNEKQKKIFRLGRGHAAGGPSSAAEQCCHSRVADQLYGFCPTLTLVGRYGFYDVLAADLGFYFVGLSGGTRNPKTIHVNLYLLTWNPNLEVQLVRNDRVSWMLFAGPVWSFTPGNYVTYDSKGKEVGASGFNIYLSGLNLVRSLASRRLISLFLLSSSSRAFQAHSL